MPSGSRVTAASVSLASWGRKPWELYDMEKDRTETHDVAPENPAVVAELAALHAEWQRRTT